jgi:hypothetical protein
MFVGGGLILRGTKIKKLPAHITRIDGDLNIANTQIKYLPDGLEVKGRLIAGNSGLAELPENLHVHGFLSIANTCIDTLPESLVVDDSLYIEDTPIEKIPEALQHIKGSLDISNTLISELPEGLIVNDDFSYEGSQIKQLPKFLNVGSCHLYNIPDASLLPDGFTITGSLTLVYSDDFKIKMNFFPENMKVGGNLHLFGNCGIKELPEGLYVGGDLDIAKNDDIKELPMSFTIKGKLVLGNHWDIIRSLLMGLVSIEGEVEMPYESYRMGNAGVVYMKDEIQKRLTRTSDKIVTLAPPPPTTQPEPETLAVKGSTKTAATKAKPKVTAQA